MGVKLEVLAPADVSVEWVCMKSLSINDQSVREETLPKLIRVVTCFSVRKDSYESRHVGSSVTLRGFVGPPFLVTTAPQSRAQELEKQIHQTLQKLNPITQKQIYILFCCYRLRR